MTNERFQGMRIGTAWYREAEWQRLRELAADPDSLEQSYPEWLATYEDAVEKLAAEGMVTERVEVVVAELQAWCDAQKRPLDGSARAEYATELLRRRYTKRGVTGPQFWR